MTLGPEQRDLNKLIGERIKQRREEISMTQESLGGVIDAPQCTISLMEKGEKTISVIKLIKIASVLGVNMDMLTKGFIA
jgi:transcriptional regulator with XRE-family HTH domain